MGFKINHPEFNKSKFKKKKKKRKQPDMISPGEQHHTASKEGLAARDGEFEKSAIRQLFNKQSPPATKLPRCT